MTLIKRMARGAVVMALFRTPEFSQLNAHGNSHYTLSVSAFRPQP
ncbi:hypothetical protein WG899_17120 [Paucibacter sp. AS339]